MRVIGVPGAPPERTFVGGLWSRAMSAMWPLARLEFWDWGIRIRGSVRGVRWLVGSWQARYDELTAELVVVPVASRGVLLNAGAAEPVVFWSRRGHEILDHLGMHGVPVSHTPTRLSWGANLYHP